MRIIVTGGAGFIGSHIVDAYVRAGHRVALIDNLSTGFLRNVNSKVKFYRGDIRNLALVRKIFRREKPQFVNHHAATAAVIESLRNPIPTFENNVIGTANVLIAFGEYGAGKQKKFVFSSTGGALYGDPTRLPADEDTPLIPPSPYGLSKLLGEEVIAFYAREYRVNYLIFRYPNVYGPRQNPKGEAGVVAIFGGLMKKGKKPIIFGDGAKCRDYIYIDDIVRANLTGLTRGQRATVNLGWGKLVSDQKIFDTVAKYAGFRGKPLYAPFRKGEVYKISLDARRAKKVLGWTPKINLEEGIARTVASL